MGLRDKTEICLPPTVSAKLEIDIVVKYLRDNRKFRRMPFISLAQIAIDDAFPCGKF